MKRTQLSVTLPSLLTVLPVCLGPTFRGMMPCPTSRVWPPLAWSSRLLLKKRKEIECKLMAEMNCWLLVWCWPDRFCCLAVLGLATVPGYLCSRQGPPGKAGQPHLPPRHQRRVLARDHRAQWGNCTTRDVIIKVYQTTDRLKFTTEHFTGYLHMMSREIQVSVGSVRLLFEARQR